MNDSAIAALLRDASDSLVGEALAPPPAALLAQGTRLRRRRTVAACSGLAAAVAVAGALFAGLAATGDRLVPERRAAGVESTLRPAYGTPADPSVSSTLTRTLTQDRYRPGADGLTLLAPPIDGRSWASFVQEEGQPCTVYYGPLTASPDCPIFPLDDRSLFVQVGSDSSQPGAGKWIAHGFVRAEVTALYAEQGGERRPVELYAGPQGFTDYNFFLFGVAADVRDSAVVLRAYDKQGTLVQERRVGGDAGAGGASTERG
jgi:hypothetical protein